MPQDPGSKLSAQPSAAAEISLSCSAFCLPFFFFVVLCFGRQKYYAVPAKKSWLCEKHESQAISVAIARRGETRQDKNDKCGGEEKEAKKASDLTLSSN